MEKQSLTIRQWAEDDRPREKLIHKGKNALSDAELLAVLIGTGSSSKSAVDVGRELLSITNGDLYEFGQLRLSQLQSIKGIGESKAVTILAALELGRRRKEQQREKRKKMSSSKAVYLEMKSYFEDLKHEEFYVMYLSRTNQVIRIHQTSVGGMTGTVVDAKIVFKTGIDCGACALILVHNHPSGELRPSEQDKLLTKKISQFGTMIDMPVLDHLIVADNGYFSFSDSGLL